MEFTALNRGGFFSFSFGFILIIKIASFLLFEKSKSSSVPSTQFQTPILWQGAVILSLGWGTLSCHRIEHKHSSEPYVVVPWLAMNLPWDGGCWWFFRAWEDDHPWDRKSVTSSQPDRLDGSICSGDRENVRATRLSPASWETVYISAVPVMGIPWGP